MTDSVEFVDVTVAGDGANRFISPTYPGVMFVETGPEDEWDFVLINPPRPDDPRNGQHTKASARIEGGVLWFRANDIETFDFKATEFSKFYAMLDSFAIPLKEQILAHLQVDPATGQPCDLTHAFRISTGTARVDGGVPMDQAKYYRRVKIE